MVLGRSCGVVIMKWTVVVLALVLVGCENKGSEAYDMAVAAQSRADEAYKEAETAKFGAEAANNRATQITIQLRETQDELARVKREVSYLQ